MFGGMSTLFYTQMTGILSVSADQRERVSFLQKTASMFLSYSSGLIMGFELIWGGGGVMQAKVQTQSTCASYLFFFFAGYDNNRENGTFLK